MPYLFISNSSRRPQFVDEGVVEDNFKRAFGFSTIIEKRLEERDAKKVNQKPLMMGCGFCGNKVEYVRGKNAFCKKCKTGVLKFDNTENETKGE